MRIIDILLRRPHLILSLILLAAFVGVVGWLRMPVNLFPDSERPQVTVVTVYPGADAKDVEADVSRPIEKELSTIEDVRRVSSTSKDEMSSVTVEFEYRKGLEAAATDTANALSKVSSLLPHNIQPPMVFKISAATPAVMTLALRPRSGSPLDLSMVRQMADNQIKERLLCLANVSNVEVFGGSVPIIRITVDPVKMARYSVSPPSIKAALEAFNSNRPLGLLISRNGQYLLKQEGEFGTLDDVRNIVISHNSIGDVHLRDVASVARSVPEAQSAYHANGEPAIAINVERSPTGHSLDTFNSVKSYLPTLERDYPNIQFSVPDNQGDLIELSVSNMQDALRDAIVMTVLVIFVFLADFPLMLLAAISIPFTYLLTFAFMWILGYEFNIVTLTAVIVAVGMLLDDAIVVLENIERHYSSQGKAVHEAVVGGTEEVMLAIFSGTYATLMVLLPIIFIGGYVQTVLRPMAVTLTIALLASYVVSVTVIPMLAPVLLTATHGRRRNLVETIAALFDLHVVSPLQGAYIGLVRRAIQRPWMFIPPAMIALVLSLRQLPVIGRDLMPPMDTGIIKIAVQMYSNTSLAETSLTVAKMEKLISAHSEVTSISSMIGSEPEVISFGPARTPQQCDMTVHLTDRFHRKATIWQVESAIRQQLRDLPGVQFADVYDYGATPLSTVGAPVDVMFTGPDLAELHKLATEAADRLTRNVHGLTSVRTTWNLDSRELQLHVIPERAAQYGVSPAEIALQIQGGVRGMSASSYRVPGQDGLPLWVQFAQHDRSSSTSLTGYHIITAYGSIPLSTFGTIQFAEVPAVITHQALQRTIDIKAYRARTPITQLQSQIEDQLASIGLPQGYSISYEGEVKLMSSSFARLMSALGLGVVLLYFSLVPAFRSWIHPLTIMTAIPFGIIGAAWGLMIAGLHSSMPSMMGMILLAGIVVKNSILLIDFIEDARANGKSVDEALLESVRVRTRPILMTAVGTSIGMVPVAMGWAIGLERLAGLGTVAITGLLVSTLFTLVYVPVFYKLFETLTGWFRGFAKPKKHEDNTNMQ